MCKVTIHQPSYLPWMGFFGKVACADVLVLLDTVQFKKQEFQNRNRIRTAQGVQWLTVPVLQKLPQRVDEVAINTRVRWAGKHARSLQQSYGKAPYFAQWFADYEALAGRSWERLAPLNFALTVWLLQYLELPVKVVLASELGPARDDRTARLVDLCAQLNATAYIAGGQGQEYMDMSCWSGTGMDVIFQHYEHPEYEQLQPGFEPYLSVVDLLSMQPAAAARELIVSGNRLEPWDGSVD